MEILPPEITRKQHPRDSEKGITGALVHFPTFCFSAYSSEVSFL